METIKPSYDLHVHDSRGLTSLTVIVLRLFETLPDIHLTTHQESALRHAFEVETVPMGLLRRDCLTMRLMAQLVHFAEWAKLLPLTTTFLKKTSRSLLFFREI